jgi:hypothetical protein
LAKNGYYKYLIEKYQFGSKILLEKIKYIGEKLFNKFSSKRLISRIYMIDDNHYINFSYVPSAKKFSGTLNHDKISGNDFISILLSYQ